MKVVRNVVIAGLLVAGLSPLYAQRGCVNSPENPTAVLALVGVAGSFIAHLRGRIKTGK